MTQSCDRCGGRVPLDQPCPACSTSTPAGGRVLARAATVVLAVGLAAAGLLGLL